MVKTILIIDDEHDTLFSYSEFLNKLGYNVITTVTGDYAFKILEKNNVHLILLDLFMPIMPGLSFLRKLRKNKKYDNIKVIILTVHKPDSKLKNTILKEKKVCTYLEKTIDLDKLEKEVKKCIG
jgi:response regulator RpfG family c-di-GMP phosphodiesterase